MHRARVRRGKGHMVHTQSRSPASVQSLPELPPAEDGSVPTRRQTVRSGPMGHGQEGACPRGGSARPTGSAPSPCSIPASAWAGKHSLGAASDWREALHLPPGAHAQK